MTEETEDGDALPPNKSRLDPLSVLSGDRGEHGNPPDVSMLSTILSATSFCLTSATRFCCASSAAKGIAAGADSMIRDLRGV